MNQLTAPAAASGIAVGLLVLAIHYVGARGPALPGTGAPDGAGLYSTIWPLDTLNHYLAGVSLGALVYAVWTAATLPHPLAATILAQVPITIAWEAYERRYWGEVHNSGTERRWFEDTQADSLAVVCGAVTTVAVIVAHPSTATLVMAAQRILG